jgi:hypothetical protein
MSRSIVAAATVAAIVFAAAAGTRAQMTATPSAPTAPPTMPTAAPPAAGAIRTMIPMPAGTLALDARYVRARRSAGGYVLSGQALVKDACQSARFTRVLGNIFPPQFDVVQYRRPGTLGLLCIQRLTWVTAQPLNVTSAAPPRYVSVHSRKGFTRVPVR